MTERKKRLRFYVAYWDTDEVIVEFDNAADWHRWISENCDVSVGGAQLKSDQSHVYIQEDWDYI